MNKAKVRLAVSSIMAAVLLPGVVTAQTASPVNQNPQPGTTLQAQSYTHPVRNFSLVFPPGAEVDVKKNGDLLTYRSRKGYLVKVQSGDRNDQIPLPSMSLRLESLYLGKGKPWQARGKDIPLTISGLRAHKVIYEGSSTRSSVIFIRGKKTDFVFMFFAPRDRYEDLKPGFEWILSNFQPAADEGGARKTVTITKPPQQPVKPVTLTPYKAQDLGMQMSYPDVWAVTKTSAMALFSGKANTPAYAVLVGLQNLDASTDQDAAKAALQKLKKDLARQTAGLTVFKQGRIKTADGEDGLAGQSFIAGYRYRQQSFKKWVVAVAGKSDRIVHIWSYTAPTLEFERYQGIARQMLASWRLL